MTAQLAEKSPEGKKTRRLKPDWLASFYGTAESCAPSKCEFFRKL
jgi:hypothetical protein